MAEPYDPNEPFGSFVKCIKDIMQVVEAAGCACALEQITSKAYNLINKSQAHPDGYREWKRKPNNEKSWANLKRHFSIEAKDCRKKSAHQARSTCQAAHATNQALLEAQSNIRECASSFLSEFQQVMKTQKDEEPTQQAHETTTSSELHSLIKELRSQLQESCEQNKALCKAVQSMGQGKENQPPNPGYNSAKNKK